MGIGEIIYGLITLILMVLIIFSPLIRKIVKSVDKSNQSTDSGPGKSETLLSGSGRVSEDDIYESVNSHRVVQRILSENESSEKINFIEPEQYRPLNDYSTSASNSVIKKLDKMATLKRAVIWKEILSSPVALRDLGGDDYF